MSDDDLPEDLAHITPAYCRALWIAVGLNVGCGLVEISGSGQRGRDRGSTRLGRVPTWRPCVAFYARCWLP